MTPLRNLGYLLRDVAGRVEKDVMRAAELFQKGFVAGDANLKVGVDLCHITPVVVHLCGLNDGSCTGHTPRPLTCREHHADRIESCQAMSPFVKEGQCCFVTRDPR